MSEDEEQFLPNEIKKLKITSNEEKANLPSILNPFMQNTLTDVEENAQQQNCRRCRLRRRSESILDDKTCHPNANDEAASTTTNAGPARPCKHTAQHNKHTLKRTVMSTSGDRKIYMREPMLRNLPSICAHNKVRRKLIPSESDSMQANKSEDVHEVENDYRFPARGMTDFRSLIEECQSMLQQINYDDAKDKHNKMTQPFKCHRTPLLAAKSTVDPDLLSLENISLTTTTAAETQSIIPAARTTNTTSCSQQAGNSVMICDDDCSIDELASYFDTFVHIPKKMSTMAEMMYI